MEQEDVVKLLLAERVKISGYIFVLVRRHELVEDVFQNVCVLALQKHAEIRDPSHLLGWMRAAARFYSMNVLRKHRREKLPLTDSVLDAMETSWRAHDDTPSTSLIEALHGCLERLSKGAQNLLQLRYAQDIPTEEIARQLNRPLNSVYVSFSRAHAALADCVFRKLAAEKRGDHA